MLRAVCFHPHNQLREPRFSHPKTLQRQPPLCKPARPLATPIMLGPSMQRCKHYPGREMRLRAADAGF